MMRLLLVVVFESFVKNLLEFSRAGIKFLSRAMSKNSSSDALLKCLVKPFVLALRYMLYDVQYRLAPGRFHHGEG